MEQYIPKSALVAEINRLIELLKPFLGACAGQIVAEANSKIAAYNRVKDIINATEVKEVDLKEEIPFQWSKFCLNGKDKDSFVKVAKHFFELGLSVSNPITARDRVIAEDIIVNLMTVQKDYHIDLTKETDWLRNKVKK